MGGSSGNIYQPSNSNLSGANSNLQSIQGQNYSALQGYTPQVAQNAQAITGQYMNNPYASQAQAGANTASQYGTNSLAPGQAGMASNLSALGQQIQPAITSTLQNYFAPNNALYNQQYQKTIDNSNAINSMYGLGQSPYGANLTDQAAQTFNNNWQQQLAQLQNLGANTIGQLGSTVGNAYTNASNLGTAGLNTYNQSAALPSTAYTSNLTGQLGALSGQNTAVGGASDILNNLASQYQNYLQYGTNAGQAAAQAQNQGLGGLGSLFGNIFGLGGQSGGGGGLGNFLGSILPSIGSASSAADPFAMAADAAMEFI